MVRVLRGVRIQLIVIIRPDDISIDIVGNIAGILLSVDAIVPLEPTVIAEFDAVLLPVIVDFLDFRVCQSRLLSQRQPFVSGKILCLEHVVVTSFLIHAKHIFEC